MNDDEKKRLALELASAHNEVLEETMQRASEYLAFLRPKQNVQIASTVSE